MRTITCEEWKAEGAALFGDNQMDWRFVCPVCHHVASVADWYSLGAAGKSMVAFSCVGRLNAGSSEAFSGKPGPCNYAGGGLFGMNPVTVILEDNERTRVFEFDKPKKEVYSDEQRKR